MSTIQAPPNTERYSGLRKVYSDSFAGSNVNLHGVRGWNKISGSTATIGESAGVAYSSTNNAFAWYQNATGSYNRNRYAQAAIRCLASNIAAGLVLSVGAANTKYHFMAYLHRTASADDLYYSEQYGAASPITGLIQSLATAGTTRTLTIRRSGRKVIVECAPGAVYYTRTLGGSIDLSSNDPAGLYYASNNLFGSGNQATWDDFIVRCYPYR